MLKLRDNTNRIVLMLGVMFFLFISSSAQACMLAGGGCVELQQSHPQAMAKMQCHVPATGDSQANTHSNSGQTDEDCCVFMPADLVDFASAQVGNPSPSQLSPQWFLLHFISFPSFHFIDFVQREIISPPPELSIVLHSPDVTSLNSGRAPPSAVLA